MPERTAPRGAMREVWRERRGDGGGMGGAGYLRREGGRGGGVEIEPMSVMEGNVMV